MKRRILRPILPLHNEILQKNRFFLYFCAKFWPELWPDFWASPGSQTFWIELQLDIPDRPDSAGRLIVQEVKVKIDQNVWDAGLAQNCGQIFTQN